MKRSKFHVRWQASGAHRPGPGRSFRVLPVIRVPTSAWTQKLTDVWRGPVRWPKSAAAAAAAAAEASRFVRAALTGGPSLSPDPVAGRLQKFPEIMYFSAYDFTCEIIEVKSIQISVGAAYTTLFLRNLGKNFLANLPRWPIEHPLAPRRAKI